MKMPLYKEEIFADNVSEYGVSRKIFSDKRAKNYALKNLNNIQSDKQSKNKKWSNMTNFGTGHADRFKLKMINPFDVEFQEDISTKDRNKIEEIKSSGDIRKPIEVWNKYDSDDYYQVDNGHHRTIAAQERGDERIPAIVFDNEDSRKLHRKRESLSPYEDTQSKNMSQFTAAEENEIVSLDWNKSQKGKKLGEGHFGEVFEVKDNPKFILKVPKDNQGSYHGSTKEEMNKFDMFGDNNLIAPSFETKQGIVREKLDIVSRGATKQDWDKKDKRVSGYSFFEQNNISKPQAQQVVDGVNQLSNNNILIDDELQIGINSKGTPYMFDIGTLRKTKYNNYDGYARDENDPYKQRFLKGINQEDLFDRDYEAERKQSDKELNEISGDKQSKNMAKVEFKNLKTTVYKNPEKWETQDIINRARQEGIVGAEPKVRNTYDEEDNKYSWMAMDTTHSDVENALLKDHNILTNQNKFFDIAYDRLSPEDKKHYDKINSDKQSKNNSKPNKLLSERINKLPLVFAFGDEGTEGKYEKGVLHLQDVHSADYKKLPKGMKIGHKTLLHTLKKNPYLLSEIEKRPTYIGIGNKQSFSDVEKETGAYNLPSFDKDDNFVESTIVIKPQDADSATLILHELKHTDQNTEGKTKEFNKQQALQTRGKNFDSIYTNVPFEVEADNYANNIFIEKKTGLKNLELGQAAQDYKNNKISKAEFDMINNQHKKQVIKNRAQNIKLSMQQIGDGESIQSDNESKNKINIPFITKKEKVIDVYPEVTNEQFREEQQQKANLEATSYGEVKSYSGEKVGNAMIAADFVIPTGRTLTLAALGVKKYVDQVKLVKTDEHDNKYKIPRIEVHKKSNKTTWTPEHNYEEEYETY